MIEVRGDVTSLEEQLLRVLYEGSASARECAARIAPYARVSTERTREVEALLHELARSSYIAVDCGVSAIRYGLTSAGSRRLAELAE